MMFKDRNAWESLSLEEAFHTPVFKVFKERSRCLRSGGENDFYYFRCVDWVNVIALTPERSIVMIRQFRHASGRWEIEIPGGAIDRSDKNPMDAAERELFEETGFAGENPRIIGKVCPNPALQGNDCFTVLLENAVRVSEPDMELTEDIETIPMRWEKVRDMAESGAITHGIVLNALYFYEMYKNKQGVS